VNCDPDLECKLDSKQHLSADDILKPTLISQTLSLVGVVPSIPCVSKLDTKQENTIDLSLWKQINIKT
jgi:hypothetical protein